MVGQDQRATLIKRKIMTRPDFRNFARPVITHLDDQSAILIGYCMDIDEIAFE